MHYSHEPRHRHCSDITHFGLAFIDPRLTAKQAWESDCCPAETFTQTCWQASCLVTSTPPCSAEQPLVQLECQYYSQCRPSTGWLRRLPFLPATQKSAQFSSWCHLRFRLLFVRQKQNAAERSISFQHSSHGLLADQWRQALHYQLNT